MAASQHLQFRNHPEKTVLNKLRKTKLITRHCLNCASLNGTSEFLFIIMHFAPSFVSHSEIYSLQAIHFLLTLFDQSTLHFTLWTIQGFMWYSHHTFRMSICLIFSCNCDVAMSLSCMRTPMRSLLVRMLSMQRANRDLCLLTSAAMRQCWVIPMVTLSSM